MSVIVGVAGGVKTSVRISSSSTSSPGVAEPSTTKVNLSTLVKASGQLVPVKDENGKATSAPVGATGRVRVSEQVFAPLTTVIVALAAVLDGERSRQRASYRRRP